MSFIFDVLIPGYIFLGVVIAVLADFDNRFETVIDFVTFVFFWPAFLYKKFRSTY